MAVTILTGAGASRPFDYPTTTEFFPEFSELPPGQQKVIGALRKQAKEPLDVEDVLQLVQPTIDFLNTDPGRFFRRNIRTEWVKEVQAFGGYVKDRCFDLYGELPDSNAVISAYGPLLDLSGWREHAVSLFTTNYDPVSDVLLELGSNEGIPCFDGFGPTGLWDESKYGSKTGLDVFRLHGSMSWVLQRGHVRNTRDYSLRRGRTEHLLIFPGYKGNPANEQQAVYSFSHQAFCEDLLTTNYLIAIGFSFRDSHINDAVAQGLRENEALRIVIVNPEWPPGMQNILGGRKDSLGNRVVHVKGKFGTEDTLEGIARHMDSELGR